MKTPIKRTAIVLFAALGVLGSGLAAARGGDGMPRDCGWHAMSAERVKDKADLGLARLELALAIKPEQKGAWDQFKTAMLRRAERMGADFEARAKEVAPKTALERMERMEVRGKAHLAELAETRNDVEALYGKLSDAQKKVFDAEFRHGFGGDGPRHAGMRGEHRPRHEGMHGGRAVEPR
ncbi:Spy/CpxP family protein refolding chaperone [Azoarcus olearius]|uniref:Hypothetical secreted protein n=1 Tax=Azoarcus sp. (strain BH72) TaxID=418699 RepID=A1K955_AZOSB|nr:Spy/CpxP family protein refolding chaperone [Azoarcus olearius]CAL95360.1 hypothetical secreted protein [Azoarcus olearius]